MSSPEGVEVAVVNPQPNRTAPVASAADSPSDGGPTMDAAALAELNAGSRLCGSGSRNVLLTAFVRLSFAAKGTKRLYAMQVTNLITDSAWGFMNFRAHTLGHTTFELCLFYTIWVCGSLTSSFLLAVIPKYAPPRTDIDAQYSLSLDILLIFCAELVRHICTSELVVFSSLSPFSSVLLD